MADEVTRAKRTFGLISDYGGDSDSSSEEESPKKHKNDTPDIQGGDKEVESVDMRNTSVSWERARREYEERSMLYSFIASAEEDENAQEKPKQQSTECSDKKGQDDSTEHEKKSKDDTTVSRGVDSDDKKCKDDSTRLDDKKGKEVNNENVTQDTGPTGATRETNSRDWEIKEIEKEIAEQQKVWEPVYSDDEGNGAEDAAVHKDLKRRAKVMKEVAKEVVPAPANKPSENNSAPGEGWKRLQMRAETRVKNFPELYQTYPIHKFPLRD